MLTAIRNFVSAKLRPTPLPSYAIHQLDERLVKHMGKKRGFFIEAGAHDGLQFSNTLYLEKHFQWRGMLIEPVPELAALCAVNRPQCITKHAALVGPDFPDRDIEMWACGLMSFVEGSFKSIREAEEHLVNSRRVEQPTPRKIRVPAASLSALLDAEQIPRIDLLSLDVEGFEAEALRGLDLSRHAPTWILVEARYASDIHAVLDKRYCLVDSLTERDLLFRIKRT